MEFKDYDEFVGKVNTLNLKKGDVMFIKLTDDITSEMARSISKLKDDIEETFGFSVPICVISDKISGVGKLEIDLATKINQLKNQISII